MKKSVLAIAAFLAACQGVAQADVIVSASIDSSRFDGVTTFYVTTGGAFPAFQELFQQGTFDVVVCNQSLNGGSGTATASTAQDFVIAPGQCRAFAKALKIKVDAGSGAPPSQKPWNGVMYWKFHEGP